MAATKRQWTAQRERDVKRTLYRFMGELYATKAALYLKVTDGDWMLVVQYGFTRSEPVARSFADDHPMVRMVRAFDRDSRYYNSSAEVGELSEYLSSAGTRRLLLVPLVDASELVGFVDVRDKGGQRPFTDGDLELARTIGRALTELVSEDVSPMPETAESSAPATLPMTSTLGRSGGREGEDADALLDDPGFDEINMSAAELVTAGGVVAVALSITTGASGGTVVHQQDGACAVEIEPVVSHQTDALMRALLPIPPRDAWRCGVRRVAGSAPVTVGAAIATAVLMSEKGAALTASVINDGDPVRARELTSRLGRRVLAVRDASRLRVARRGLARRLLQPGNHRYPELVAHSLGVSRLCWSIAKVLELDDGDAETAALAGLLHDVGMRELDYDRLYMHPTPGPEDRRTYRMHVEVGDRIVRVGGLEEVADAVRHHHERWDGNGYPERLRADDIPVFARIVHVAEVFDLFTAANSYRPAVSRERALAILERAAGHQFDPQVVTAITKVVG